MGHTRITDNMTPEIKFRTNVKVVDNDICEGIWNKHAKVKLNYMRYSNFCLIRDDDKCRAGAGTIMAIDTNSVTKPYWYAVGFVSQGPTCRGYQMCEKVITNMYWIKYVLSFEYGDYNENKLPKIDLNDYDYTVLRGKLN